MKVMAMKSDRRQLLSRMGAALGGVLLLRSLAPGRALAQGQTILSKEVGQVPLDPKAGEWEQVKAVEIPLSAQVVVKPRLYEASVKSLKVRSLYDAQKLGFLLEWGDTGQNMGLGQQHSFRDSAALQFPADPAKPIPYFGMGQPGNPVVLYHWKADWQFGPEYDVNEVFPGMWVDYYPYSGKQAREMVEASDYAAQAAPPFLTDKAYIPAWWVGNLLADPQFKKRTPVEKLTAAGFGSLTTAAEQDGEGKGERQGEGWRVVIAVPRRQTSFEFARGQVVPVNFAVWDGSKKERGGEKAVSTWNWLALEKPAGATPFLLPAALAVGVGLLEWALLRRLRRTNGR